MATTSASLHHAHLSTLPTQTGSATYTSPHTHLTIHASASAPLEASRRDERPDSAILDITLRTSRTNTPGGSTGGPRERRIESVLEHVLRDVVDVKSLPRTVIQIVLVLLEEEGEGVRRGGQGAEFLTVLPHLLHAAELALLDANIPLLKSFVAVTVAAASKGKEEAGDAMIVDGGSESTMLRVHPDLTFLATATAVHVFGFALPGRMREFDGRESVEGEMPLLLAQSEGSFEPLEWARALELAQQACVGVDGLEAWLRKVAAEGAA